MKPRKKKCYHLTENIDKLVHTSPQSGFIFVFLNYITQIGVRLKIYFGPEW